MCKCRSGVKQSVLSVSLCHQNLGLITTTKGLNTSKRHSNNDNSEKIVHGVPIDNIYLNVAEAVLIVRISSYLWPWSRSKTAQLRLGTRLSWPRIHRARIRGQSMSACHAIDSRV